MALSLSTVCHQSVSKLLTGGLSLENPDFAVHFPLDLEGNPSWIMFSLFLASYLQWDPK